MRYYKNLILFCCFLLFPLGVTAQTISIDNSKTPVQLVQDLFTAGSCVQPTNITINGHDFGGGQKSFAAFSSNGSSFPLSSGLVISTGRANSAIGPNSSLLSEGPTSWAGDPDLEQAINENNTINATVVEFDFVAVTNYVSFNYIFSSEQYLSNPSSNQCNYSDGFAFLLKRVGTANYQNLAVVPDTNIPVKVTTVRGSGTICPPANIQYFDAFNGTNHPTNFNGQTKVMVAEADITPGATYHIKMVIADQGNNLYDSAIFIGGNTFNNDFSMGDDRLVANGNPLCPGETLTVAPDYTIPGTLSYTWYRNDVAIPGYINVSSPSYVVSGPGIYKLVADLGSCSVNGYINIEYAPLIANNTTLVQCDDDNNGTSIFNLTSAAQTITNNDPNMTIVGYFRNAADAQNLQNPITTVDSFPGTSGTTAVARISNQYGCIGYAAITLQISNNMINPLNPVAICDSDAEQDGIYQFNLNNISQQIQDNNTLPPGVTIVYYESAQDALMENNPLSSPFENTVANQQVIFARIVNGPDCYGLIPITLKVNTFLPNDFDDETVGMCQNVPVMLDAGSGFNSYSWNTVPIQTTQTITVTTAGLYTVTVTNSDTCEAQKTFTVVESGSATITDIDVNSFAGSNNSITVFATGLGNYEYSLDNSIFQDSAVFTGVLPGTYTVYVRDKNGCLPITTETVYVLDYPNFFTPNGDGINDIWSIKNLNADYPNAKLYVFDRYGKLLKQLSPSGLGWNGQFNNYPLPSDDYWFALHLDNGRIIKGHFALKR